MSSHLTIDHKAIAEFCRRHGVRKLALFGSVLTKNFRPDSDVDVLFEFEDGHEISLREMLAMEDELSEIFGGRKVDLVRAKQLNRWIAAEVIASAEVQYARQ